MAQADLKKFVLLFEDRTMVSMRASRFKLDDGITLYDDRGDMIAAVSAENLLLITEEEYLEDIESTDDMEDLIDEYEDE